MKQQIETLLLKYNRILGNARESLQSVLKKTEDPDGLEKYYKGVISALSITIGDLEELNNSIK